MTVKISRVFVASLALVGSVASAAQQTYLGLYLNGQKIGYSSYSAKAAKLGVDKATRSDSRTVMSAGLLGTAMTIQIDSVTWTNSLGRPLRMDFLMKSGGRNQRMQAFFAKTNIKVNVDNGGTKSTRTIPLPKDAKVVDDPLNEMISGNAKPGAKRSFYILDPTTASLIKNETRMVGKVTADIQGKKVQATLIEVIDPRASTKVYLSGKGDVLRVDGPMGITMYPESRAKALAGRDAYSPGIDLAVATSIRADEPITSPETIESLILKITGRDLKRVPSGDHQTVTGDGEAWTIAIHPPDTMADAQVSVADAGQQQPEWLKPSLHIPAKSPQFAAIASKEIGDAQEDVRLAADRIRAYVLRTMQPNAGIGVLRDASEVLKTKEGVCRDYAILTATLLRAGGIPARLASGLVSLDGAFYYHAWAEYWNGTRWIGLDSTQQWSRITPTHIKLAEGNVEQAFTFLFLDKVAIEVVQLKRKP